MIDHLLPLAEYHETVRHLLPDILGGCELAKQALLDFVQEEGIEVNPFKVGECYYVETLTLYYIGKCVEVSPCWIKFEKASWVHWTGRKGTLMKHKSFNKKHFKQGERSPRTEYIGEWTESIAAITGFTSWSEEELPQESLT